MAAGEERALRRRIRSVNSTRKITRAMELISSSRIAKAQHAIVATRPYLQGMRDLLSGLADNLEARKHPIFAESSEIRGVVVVVLAADRGLCGAYNSNVLRSAERLAKSHMDAGRSCTLIVIGKKAQNYFRYRGYDVERSFLGLTDKPVFGDAGKIASSISEAMSQEGVDLVQIVYTRFMSLGTQAVVTEQVFPIVSESADSSESSITDSSSSAGSSAVSSANSTGSGGQSQSGGTAQSQHAAGSIHLLHVDFEFEPDAGELLDDLVPKAIETLVYGALLDASASEHASRHRAMKAATDNADEFAKSLTRQMNRARQDSITTEIMEIVGGAEALG
ncbi:MAG TPA: F0F1 ATP synthase subunit gamma [Acidimicrobiales bacterium]|nr:F0F1 ATP synthase subunit gamma [Acidimicrobiales bacterium]